MGMESLSLLLAQASQDHSDNVNAMLIAAIGVLASIIVSWATAYWTIRGDERQSIRDGNLRLIEFAIEYPFLESDAFCSQWPHSSNAENTMRYEVYCCHVFNLVQHCWEFCDGNESAMVPILHPDELIWRHRRWWQGDDENKCYPEEFRRYVDWRIRSITQEKERGSQGTPH